jgi:hypothetical protein
MFPAASSNDMHFFSEPEMPIDLEPRIYTAEEFSKIRQGARFALEFEDLSESLTAKTS